MMKFSGFVMFIVFGFALYNYVPFLEQPIGYLVIFLLFTGESIRSYCEGLDKGVEIAEGITITGQYIIKWAEKHVNDFLNKTLSTNKDYVIAIDTDSVYVGLNDLVQKVYGVNGEVVLPSDKVVDFLDKVCGKIESDVLDVAFKELKENCNAYKQRISMKREGIANREIGRAHV